MLGLQSFITHPIFYISFLISWIVLCSVLKMKTPKQKHKLKLIWYSFSYENRNFCFFLFLLLVSLAYDFQKMHMFFWQNYNIYAHGGAMWAYFDYDIRLEKSWKIQTYSHWSPLETYEAQTRTPDTTQTHRHR
jgi:hypothetical protein